MNKRARITVVAVVIFLLIGLGIAALPGLVALNKVKNRIAQTLASATGRTVTIAQLHFTLYPWLGIRLDGATLGNAPGFGVRPLARIQDAIVEVQVLPLFSGHIVLRRVVLAGLHLNLMENAQGQTNWQSLVAAHKLPAAQSHSSEKQEAPAFALLRAAGISVRDSAIRYRNAKTHTDDDLTDFQLQSGTIEPGHPVNFVTKGIVSMAAHTLPFKVAGALIIDGHTYTLHSLKVKVAGLSLKGRVSAVSAPAGWSAHGQFVIPPFAPRSLLKTLAIHYTPSSPHALTQAQGQLTFVYTPQALSVPALTFAFDQTVITGRLSATIHPAVFRAHLAINQFALGPYLPQAAVKTTAVSVPASSTPTSSAPFTALAHLHFLGNVTIGALRVHGLSLTGVHAHMVIDNGQVRLKPLVATLYQGSLGAAAVANTQSIPLTWRLHAQLAQVHVGAALRALRLYKEFSGILTGAATVHGQGTTKIAIERSLTGTAHMAIQHGALRGLDLDFIAQNPRIAVGAHRFKKVSGTAFSHLHASAVIHNGIIQTHDLVITTARARVDGAGHVDLPKGSVNYLLNVTLFNGLTIPVRVQGPFGHVGFSVSLNSLLDTRQGQKAVSHALHGLGDKLKQLFQ